MGAILDWFNSDLGPLKIWMWFTIGVLVVLIVLLIVIFTSRNKKKKKAANEIVYLDYEGQYATEQGAKLVIAGPNAWLIDPNGKTELVRSADNLTPLESGDKVYYINSDVVTKVVKVGEDFEKIESKQNNYLTISFVTKAQVKIGESVYSR